MKHSRTWVVTEYLDACPWLTGYMPCSAANAGDVSGRSGNLGAWVGVRENLNIVWPGERSTVRGRTKKKSANATHSPRTSLHYLATRIYMHCLIAINTYATDFPYMSGLVWVIESIGPKERAQFSVLRTLILLRHNGSKILNIDE